MDMVTADDQAAHMAEQMLKSGAAGDMPTTRKEAQGGMAAMAGGKQIDEDAEKGGYGGDMAKANKTGSDVTNEPGRQGTKPQTNSNVTSEPDREYPSALPGDPSQLDQDADDDDQHRKRKPGKIGVSNGADGGQPGTGDGSNLSQNDDSSLRGRKDGRVGISKGLKRDPADAKAQASEEKEQMKDVGMNGDEDDDAEKGGIDADDLIKSLETLEAVAQGSTVPAPADRREVLGQKLAEGTLSKSERQELAGLLAKADDTAAEDPLEKSGDGNAEDSFQEQFAADPSLQEGYEVSTFLERHSQMTAAALDQVQDRLAKSLEMTRDRASAFNTQLAKSLLGMAKLAQRQESLIKSLTDRLASVENTPLPRKGVSTSRGQVLQKSMDGEVGAGSATDELSRVDVMDTLEQMAKSMHQTPSGHRVDFAMATVEQTGQIPRSLLDDVVSFRRKNGTVHTR
jgi:surface antigen